MIDLVVGVAIVALLVGAAALSARYGDARAAARSALRDKLERGDIRAEEYAVHLRALDKAA